MFFFCTYTSTYFPIVLWGALASLPFVQNCLSLCSSMCFLFPSLSLSCVSLDTLSYLSNISGFKPSLNFHYSPTFTFSPAFLHSTFLLKDISLQSTYCTYTLIFCLHIHGCTSYTYLSSILSHLSPLGGKWSTVITPNPVPLMFFLSISSKVQKHKQHVVALLTDTAWIHLHIWILLTL